MTIVECPHGCGGTVDTDVGNDCLSCRRGIDEIEVMIAPDEKAESPVRRRPTWCWEWWGPANHRMRCRLPSGHDGEHWDHESRDGSMIVAVNGEKIR